MESPCYMCKYWKRCHDDFIIGMCQQFNHYRFQCESCELFDMLDKYVFASEGKQNMSMIKLRNEEIAPVGVHS